MEFGIAIILYFFMYGIAAFLLVLGLVKLGGVLKIDITDKRFRYALIFIGAVSAIVIFFNMPNKVEASLSVVILIIVLFVIMGYGSKK